MFAILLKVTTLLMETNHTNKDLLFKGIKKLLIAVFLFFTGPSLLYLILSNNDKPFYYLLLSISILICLLAVYFLFKGIMTIMDSMFKK